ncbi:MAG: hypothetical protein FWD57_10660, partial [Polyangiaceae bacterium]|nr:hypothetical protein [Polyangiaceae bacterium]
IVEKPKQVAPLVSSLIEQCADSQRQQQLLQRVYGYRDGTPRGTIPSGHEIQPIEGMSALRSFVGTCLVFAPVLVNVICDDLVSKINVGFGWNTHALPTHYLSERRVQRLKTALSTILKAIWLVSTKRFVDSPVSAGMPDYEALVVASKMMESGEREPDNQKLLHWCRLAKCVETIQERTLDGRVFDPRIYLDGLDGYENTPWELPHRLSIGAGYCTDSVVDAEGTTEAVNSSRGIGRISWTVHASAIQHPSDERVIEAVATIWNRANPNALGTFLPQIAATLDPFGLVIRARDSADS